MRCVWALRRGYVCSDRCKIGFASEAMSQTMIVTPGPVGLPQLEWTVLMMFMILPALIAPKLVTADARARARCDGMCCRRRTQAALAVRMLACAHMPTLRHLDAGG